MFATRDRKSHSNVLNISLFSNIQQNWVVSGNGTNYNLLLIRSRNGIQQKYEYSRTLPGVKQIEVLRAAISSSSGSAQSVAGSR